MAGWRIVGLLPRTLRVPSSCEGFDFITRKRYALVMRPPGLGSCDWSLRAFFVGGLRPERLPFCTECKVCLCVLLCTNGFAGALISPSSMCECKIRSHLFCSVILHGHHHKFT